MIETGKNYLITTDDWFYGPDGKKYRGAWGKVELIQDNELSIKTNRNSTNWFAKVGTDDYHVIIAGCQIHYAVRCDKIDDSDAIKESQYDATGYRDFFRRNEVIKFSDEKQ